MWVKRYNGPANGRDEAVSVASPGIGRVYVTGHSWGGRAIRSDYATIAYNVFTGTLLWVQRYNGSGNGGDAATSMAASAGRVFVTCGSRGASSGQDYATIAYNG